jgi:signal transduction histidine kinase
MTIRLRLAVWYGLAIAVTVSAVSVVVWLRQSAELRVSVDEALAVQAADAAGNVDAGDGASALAEDPARPGIFTIVFDRRGRIVGASRSAPSALPEPPAGGSTWRGPTARSATELNAVSTRDGGLVVAGASLASVDDAMTHLAGVLAVTTAAAVLVSIGGGWLLGRRALAPIAQITAEANRIDAAEPRIALRLAAPNPRDELGLLAETLNRLLDRADRSVREQRAFVAQASHDLRTPIAALRMELELALRPERTPEELRAAISEALGDVRRLGGLADELLALAAASADGRASHVEPVAVRQLVEDAVRLARGASVDQTPTITQDVEDTTLLVDRVRLTQALVNLLSNAAHHDPTGDGIVVRAHRVPSTNTALAGVALDVEVLDRGPGVPAELVPTLFTPFARPRIGLPGASLGLATAAAAVRSLGGRIGYRDRPGGGAWFWFEVPTGEAPTAMTAF